MAWVSFEASKYDLEHLFVKLLLFKLFLSGGMVGEIGCEIFCYQFSVVDILLCGASKRHEAKAEEEHSHAKSKDINLARLVCASFWDNCTFGQSDFWNKILVCATGSVAKIGHVFTLSEVNQSNCIVILDDEVVWFYITVGNFVYHVEFE